MLFRSWNLAHGHTSPPSRRSYLREMVELITADKPGFVCLQEVPAWALNQIGEWAGMQSIPARSRKSKVGFVPVPAGLGRRIPALGTSGRAARDGSGNVILAPADAKLRQVKQITLNTNPFCEEQARKLGLTPKLARWWERERRVCHLAKIELPNRRRLQIATLETTRYPADLRLADAELRRAASFVDRASDLEEIVVVAGHFNTTFAQSETLQWLMARETDRYTATEPLSDVLVREGRAADARAWSDDERSYDGKLLSEHAPVELQLLARVVRQVAPQEAPLGPIPRPEPAPTPARPKADDDERWETEERWEAEDAGRWETDEGGWETER